MKVESSIAQQERVNFFRTDEKISLNDKFIGLIQEALKQKQRYLWENKQR